MIRLERVTSELNSQEKTGRSRERETQVTEVEFFY